MTLTVLDPPGLSSMDEVAATIRPAVLPVGRPYVLANFVSTVDGSIALAGESGTIAEHAPGDRVLFRLLRESVDAVLAGTATLAHEGYRRLVRDPEARGRREAKGLLPDPLAVVLSRSGRIPDGSPRLDDPDQPRRVFTGAAADPATAFAALRAGGVDVLLCEGGPTLLGDLVRRGLVDELFITFAPVLGGGEPERTLLGGPADHPHPLTLRGLVKAGDGLHARYAMLAPGTPSDPPQEL